MQTSRSKGREFLLEKLLNFEDSSRDALVRHLFERNDHISTSTVDITACYKEAETADVKEIGENPAERKKGNQKLINLERNCAFWASAATEMVNQLCKDMKLAQKITSWDEGILEDMLRLIEFLLDGSGAWKDLISMCKSRSKNQQRQLQVRLGHQKTYKQFADDLEDSLSSIKNEKTTLLKHLVSNDSSVKDFVLDFIKISGNSKILKIPTATLRELFVSNEAYQKREDIWRLVPSLGEKDIVSTSTELEKLTELVHTIFKFKDSSQADSTQRTRNAWLPLTLVLLLDTEHRLILVGGTQPICHESPLFCQAVRTITVQRIGENFAEIIDHCSKELADRAIKIKKSYTKKQFSDLQASVIEQSYNQVVNDDKSDWYNRVPFPAKKPVFCWAFDGLKLDESKPPCLRCQSIYPRWISPIGPINEDERKNALTDGIFSHLAPKEPRLDMEWAYCAETVAASKLYLLSNGTLSLV